MGGGTHIDTVGGIIRKSNEKSIFLFLFFELPWKFIENWGVLSTKMTVLKIEYKKMWQGQKMENIC